MRGTVTGLVSRGSRAHHTGIDTRGTMIASIGRAGGQAGVDLVAGRRQGDVETGLVLQELAEGAGELFDLVERQKLHVHAPSKFLDATSSRRKAPGREEKSTGGGSAGSSAAVAAPHGKGHPGADTGHRRHQNAEHQELLPPAAVARVDRLPTTTGFGQRADALGDAALEIEVFVLLGRHRRNGRRQRCRGSGRRRCADGQQQCGRTDHDGPLAHLRRSTHDDIVT